MILCICPNPSVDMFLHVQSLLPGQVNRADQEVRFPGGKGIHVALAARELGSDVTLLCFWAGPTGEWIRQKCRETGIICLGPQIGGWNRTCLTFRSANQWNETEILPSGPAVTAQDLQDFQQIFTATQASCDVIAASGSWPPGAGPEAYRLLLEKCDPRRTLMDCHGSSLQEALAIHPAVVHVNAQEAQEITGLPDVCGSAQALQSRCGLAVVTDGARGAVAASQEGLLRISCPVDHVISAVGSGDCLLAGLAVGMERSLPLEDTLRLAIACGAANCIYPPLGMLRGADVQRLVPNVKIGPA